MSLSGSTAQAQDASYHGTITFTDIITIPTCIVFGIRGTEPLSPGACTSGQIFMRSSQPSIDLENINAPENARRWETSYVNLEGTFEIANWFAGPGWTGVQTLVQVYAPTRDTHGWGMQSFVPITATSFKSMGGPSPSEASAYEHELSGANGNWQTTANNTHWFLKSVGGGQDAIGVDVKRSNTTTVSQLWFAAPFAFGGSVCHTSDINGSGCPKDAGIGRTAAGTIGIGNGTPGDISGTVEAAIGRFSDGVIINGKPLIVDQYEARIQALEQQVQALMRVIAQWRAR